MKTIFGLLAILAICGAFILGMVVSKNSEPKQVRIDLNYHIPIFQNGDHCELYDWHSNRYIGAGLIDGNCDEWFRDYQRGLEYQLKKAYQ